MLTYGVDPKTIYWYRGAQGYFVYGCQHPVANWQPQIALRVERDYTSKQLAAQVYRAMIY